jgi:hypothetical protein
MSNIGKTFELLFLAGIFVFSFGGVAAAQHGHDHGGTDMSSHGSMSTQGSGSHSMSMSMKDRPVQSVSVDGFKISLDIMDMTMHTSMQKMKGNPAPGDSDVSKSHAIMVVIQDTASKEIITNAKVNYTLISPSGEKETGKLDWSGDHYGRGFNPKEKGAYQIQLQIDSGGLEREAKFTQTL